MSKYHLQNKIISTKKTPLILLHGMWANGNCFKNFRLPFENDYKVYSPTLRYHEVNISSKPPLELGKTGINEYTQDILIFLLKNEIRNPILVGHSMGGLIAQILATRILPQAVVLLNPAAPKGISSVSISSFKCFIEPLLRLKFWNTPMLLSKEKFIYSMLHKLDESTLNSVLGNMVHESPKVALQIGVLDPSNETKVDANKLTAPILVIGSGCDRITPPHIVRNVAKKYAHALYWEYPQNAHWIIDEPNSAEIANDILYWLNKQL